MSADDRACQTPLLDLLRAVPRDARATYEHHSTSHSFFPYGRYAHEAADRIVALEAECARLRRVAKPIGELRISAAEILAALRELGPIGYQSEAFVSAAASAAAEARRALGEEGK